MHPGRGEAWRRRGRSLGLAPQRPGRPGKQVPGHGAPFFLIAPGASVKNVTITYPGCEGIHMMGDNALENITSDHLGEDAASVRSYFPGGAILIKDSKGFKAADKMTKFRCCGTAGGVTKKRRADASEW
ncbi:pectate lyase [Sorangium sp. So ce291]|uniref:pectate lyase n=1 Tax=Sorangium sp. So ce291 TaxID=3133294 RepID=UPI003F64763F